MENEKTEKKPRILVVDDVQINLKILKKLIDDIGYEAFTAESVNEAIELLREELPQIILTDLSMPEIDGYEFISMLKENSMTRDIPIIIISGMNSSEERIKGLEAGAVDFIAKPFEAPEVRARLNTHLKIYKMQQETENLNLQLNLFVKQQMKRLEDEQRNILYAIAQITEFADTRKGYFHLRNVAANARILAQSLALTMKYEDLITEEFIETIGVAALLHDIGKIAIPPAILTKPDVLNDEERKMVRNHTTQGAHIIQRIRNHCGNNKFLQMAEEIALNHHEKWNGEGYPNALKKLEIPLSARIIGIVGVYDVMVNDQFYRMKRTKEDVLQYIRGEAGKSFDPEIVEIFSRVINQLG